MNVFKLILFLLLMGNSTIAQTDSCLYQKFGKYETFQLTELSKMNVDRLVGLSNGHLNRTDTLQLFSPPIFESTYYESALSDFMRDQKINREEYIIQSAFIQKNGTVYLFLTLLKTHQNQNCFNKYVLFQFDGGNSFCTLLFNFSESKIISTRINGWG